MSSNLSIERGIEKFSFIYNLTVYCSRNSDRSEAIPHRQVSPENISQDNLSKSSEEQSIPSSESPTKQHSLVLTNAETADASSLAVAQPTTILNDWYVLETNDDCELDLSSLDALPESDVNNSSNKKNRLDNLLLLASVSYLLIVFWWLFVQTTGRTPIPWFASGRETISIADAEFLDYMQRSLDNIDRQVTAQTNNSASQEENPTVVYVPVYNQTNPLPSYSTQPIPIPPPPPPEFTAVEPAPKIPIPPSPTESAISENQVATAIANPKINSTLVGLIELGEASAALFKVDGLTQRIWLGEDIDDSGWILESVTKEKATVTYQGQSRVLSIGESL